MKFNKKLFLVLIPLLLLLFILSSCGIIPQTPDGKISGRVVIPPSEMSKDITGWVSAANAELTIIDSDGITHTVTTDENGYYAFEDIAVNPNTIITATITVNGNTIILKDVIPQAVAADEDYDAGDMNPESTALALTLEALITSGENLLDVDTEEIKSSDGFLALVSQLTSVLEEGGDVTEDTDIADMIEDIVNPSSPSSPLPPSSPPKPDNNVTITYNGNNNTGGTVPVDSNEYVEGATVTVLGNTGFLEKTGYNFDGWNTSVDGKGTDYAPGETFMMEASDVTLYAKWTYSLTLIAGTGGSVNIEGGLVDNIAYGEYYEGTKVEIEATHDRGYQLIFWEVYIGDVANIADTRSPITTVTMNEDMLMTANFEECTPEDFFDFDETSGTITGYDISGGLDVVIPLMIDGVLVEHIGYTAFHNKGLTSIAIPDRVTTIGDNAFSYNQLTSVTIPDCVTTIDVGAFSDNQLTSVTLGNSVTTIGTNAFALNQLTSVTIPDSVITIDNWAFYRNSLTSVTIPDSVITIGVGAFARNQLTSVTIPDSVTTISGFVFFFNYLTSVTIPDSVNTIGEDAFRWNALISVTIGTNVNIDSYYSTMGTNIGFKDVYDDGGRLSGTYNFTGGVWVKQSS